MTKEREALEIALDYVLRTTYWTEGRDRHDTLKAIKEALAQSEQEPSITKTGCGVLTLHFGFDDLPDGTKFYTTPPQRPWVGLTDEDCKGMSDGDRLVAIWVDRILKEKNT